MEKEIMKESKQTRKCWKAFEDAVLSRDKKQFELFHKYFVSKQLDKKLQNTSEEELIN